MAKVPDTPLPPTAAAAPEAAPPARHATTRRNAFEMVDRALDWLARHQSADGRWDAKAFGERCGGARCGGAAEASDPVGTTALALTAFHMASETHQSGAHRDAVRAALRYLSSVQQPSGALGQPDAPRPVLNHALGTFALTEEFGLTSWSPLREKVQKALDHLVAVRNAAGVWSAGGGDAAGDLETTTWALRALLDGRTCDLAVPDDVFTRARAWLDGPHDEPRTDVAARRTLCLHFCGAHRDDPTLAADLPSLREAVPASGGWTGPLDADLQSWIYMAAFTWGGDLWRDAWRAADETFLPLQHSDGSDCAGGSWDAGTTGSALGGRVAATARIACLFTSPYRSTYRNARIEEPNFAK